MSTPVLTTVSRDLYYHEVDYVRRLEAVAAAAREFRDSGTVLTSCSRGACQRVIEHKDKTDPQAKLFAALAALNPEPTNGSQP